MTLPTQPFAIVADIIEPGRGIGYVRERPGVDAIDFSFRRESNRWVLFAGSGDEIRAEGSTLPVALRRLARMVGVTGQAEIRDETRGDRQTIVELA